MTEKPKRRRLTVSAVGGAKYYRTIGYQSLQLWMPPKLKEAIVVTAKVAGANNTAAWAVELLTRAMIDAGYYIRHEEPEEEEDQAKAP